MFLAIGFMIISSFTPTMTAEVLCLQCLICCCLCCDYLCCDYLCCNYLCCDYFCCDYLCCMIMSSNGRLPSMTADVPRTWLDLVDVPRTWPRNSLDRSSPSQPGRILRPLSFFALIWLIWRPMVCLPVRKLVISMTSQEACMNVTISKSLKRSKCILNCGSCARESFAGSVFFSNCNLHCELPAGVANPPSSDIRLCVSLKPMTKPGGWRCQLGGGSDAAPRDARALSSLTKLLGAREPCGEDGL